MEQIVKCIEPKPFIWDGFFGLIVADKRTPIPLKEIKVSATINKFVSRVTYTQVYYNEGSSMLETEYFFPISTGACYDGFRAKIGDKVIEGFIKEKETAKKLYEVHTQQKDTVAYAEINKETHDIMKIKIGNIPPQTDIEIEFTYLEKVEIAMNKFYKFVLPSTLTPRYNRNAHKNQDLATLANYPVISKNSKDAYIWNVILRINSDDQIKFCKCPSHEDAEILHLQNQGGAAYTTTVFIPRGKHQPNKDFVVYFQTGDVTRPSYSVSAFEDGYCACIKFFPEMNQLSIDDAYIAAMNGRDPGDNLEIANAKGEFIFLLDRSGSMEGTRMNKAKDALIFFLKSLPADSYFNIVSFGDSFFLLDFDKSIKASEEKLSEAIETVETYYADMGGTEILEPLEYIATMPLIPGYQRNIFLLTDGAVSNTNEVLKFIESQKEKSRVFTLGVGNGCSQELIKEGARRGRGVHEFVGDNQNVPEKIIYLLKNAITPYVTDFSLKFEDQHLTAYVTPRPKTLGYILPNQPLEFYVIYNKKIADKKKTKATFSFFNEVKNTTESHTIELDFTDAKKDDSLLKLGMFHFCKNIQTAEYLIEEGASDISSSFKEDFSRQLLQLSLKYGILTEKTAFICLVKEAQHSDQYLHTEKIVIPQAKSVDYLEEPELDSDGSMNEFEDEDGFCSAQQYKQSTPSNYPKFSGFSYEPEGFSFDGTGGYGLSRKPGYDNYQNESFGASFGMETYADFSYSPRGYVNKSSMKDARFELNKALDKKSKETAFVSSTKPTQQSLTEVIKKQKFSGNWEPVKEVSKLLGISLDDALAKLPSQLSSLPDKEKIWITILVLTWIEENFKSSPTSWEIIHKKGLQWIEGKGAKYEDYVKEAKSIIIQRQIYLHILPNSNA